MYASTNTASRWLHHRHNLVPVLVVIALAWAWTAGAVSSEQRFAMQPQDQTAVVGSRVTLPCRVVGKSGALQWTKDDFGLGTHRNLSGFDRYSMVGSDEEGDFSLDIYPVSLEDDARYQCQVLPGPRGESGIRSAYATLTVLAPPEPPLVLQGAALTTTEDREIELECVSNAGKPAAEITWIDGHGAVVTQGVENINVPLADGRRFTVKSILKLSPKREHHNTTFTCQAQNTAERTHRAASIRLEVKYAPKVAVRILSGASGAGGRIPEGGEVRLGCTADANPSEVEYRWYINDRIIPGDFTTELVLHNVTRDLHDSIVKCEVRNPVGKSEESETLDVTYAPVIRTKPRSIQAEPNQMVTLTCDVDSNPAAEIIWSHENSPPHLRVIGTNIHEPIRDGPERIRMSISPDRSSAVQNSKRHGGPRMEPPNTNLTLTVSSQTAGRYLCRATVPGYPEVSADANVYLKGPPTIVSHRTQFGIEGDNVRVECIAFSIPKPDHVVWSFNGRNVDANDQDYSILEDPLSEGVKSTLVIRESQQKHFGMYNCSVENSYGKANVEINLMPQSNSSLLFIVFVFLAVFILVTIIIMILCLCFCRRKKPPEDSNNIEKQTQQSDRSSNISDLKLDLRAGSSVSNMDYATGGANITRCGDSDAGSDSNRPSGGVPLAGPVPLAINGEYRYSAEYVEPSFPPKNDGQNNNGYVPYVDYSRDYNPPPALLPPAMDSSRESLQSTRLQLSSLQTGGGLLGTLHPYSSDYATTGYIPNGGTTIDPRYSATYGNPYLRSSGSVGLPPPNTAVLAATPAPPPYTRGETRNAPNGAAPQVARLPHSPNGTHIVPPSTTANVPVQKRGTLATHV